MSGTAVAVEGQPAFSGAADAPSEPVRTGESTVAVQVAGSPAPDAQAIAAWAAAALEGDVRQVCVRLVDRGEGAALNLRFRGRRAATNVLSFPADEAGVLGDIAICAPVVAAEAHAQEKPLEAHFAHMVVHGVLHLKGMDHADDVDAARMEARETALLGTLGFPDPYPPA